MANHMVSAGLETNATDKRRTTSPAIPGISLATPQNYDSITNLRNRLNAIGVPYTAAYLDVMTANDMTYALRLFDDPTSI